MWRLSFTYGRTPKAPCDTGTEVKPLAQRTAALCRNAIHKPEGQRRETETERWNTRDKARKNKNKLISTISTRWQRSTREGRCGFLR